MTAVELLRAAAARARELDAAATPGPWETGTYYLTAGVKEDLFGPGRCAYCERPDLADELVWSGRADINGTVMDAHQHRASMDMGEVSVWARQPDGRRVLVVFDNEDSTDLDDLRLAAAFRSVAAPLADLLEAVADQAESGHIGRAGDGEYLLAVARALLPEERDLGTIPKERPSWLKANAEPAMGGDTTTSNVRHVTGTATATSATTLAWSLSPAPPAEAPVRVVVGDGPDLPSLPPRGGEGPNLPRVSRGGPAGGGAGGALGAAACPTPTAVAGCGDLTTDASPGAPTTPSYGTNGRVIA